MRQLIIAIVALLILVAWAIQMRSKIDSPRRDLAYIAVFTLLITVY
jgi:hypothetical protein